MSWKNLFFLVFGLAIGLIAPKAIETYKTNPLSFNFNEPATFWLEVGGSQHSLAGYINGMPCAAQEFTPDSVIVHNGKIGEQTLSLYKDNDRRGHCDGQYSLVLADINEWAFMREGSYLIVSQPFDTTSVADSCLVYVHGLGIDYVDSE